MQTLQVERLAYWLWQQRGMPDASPDADWFLAEELVTRRYKRIELSMHEVSFCAVSMHKRTR